MQIKDRVFIVTGASSGIGLATAIALSDRGAKVALLARSGDALHELARRLPGSLPVIPLLRDAPAGRVVNISSAGGSLTLNSDPKNPHRLMFGTYSSSKTALNAITLAFASALESTGIKVNAACPGFTATDLNNFQGTRTVQQAAREPVRLALLDANGPTGTFSNEEGPLPW